VNVHGRVANVEAGTWSDLFRVHWVRWYVLGEVAENQRCPERHVRVAQLSLTACSAEVGSEMVSESHSGDGVLAVGRVSVTQRDVSVPWVGEVRETRGDLFCYRGPGARVTCGGEDSCFSCPCLDSPFLCRHDLKALGEVACPYVLHLPHALSAFYPPHASSTYLVPSSLPPTLPSAPSSLRAPPPFFGPSLLAQQSCAF